MSEAGRVHNTDAFCSQAQSALNIALRYGRIKSFWASGLATATEQDAAFPPKERADHLREQGKAARMKIRCEGQEGVPGLRKSVRLELAPAPFVVQLRAVTTPIIVLAISRAD